VCFTLKMGYTIFTAGHAPPRPLSLILFSLGVIGTRYAKATIT
jgi:hypothetical protein